MSEKDENCASRLKSGIEAWNNWRLNNPDEPADLSETNLSGTDLRRANLSGAHLVSADLMGANLSGANLSGANLNFAHLTGGNLSGANLSGANLSGARLIGADFTGANLSRANLSDANLNLANLTGTNLSWADLAQTNVSNVVWSRKLMKDKYIGIRGLFSCHGNALFRRDAADQDYLDMLAQHWIGKSKLRRVLFSSWGLIDYGRSISRIFGISTAIIIFFGSLYSVAPGLLNIDSSARTWFTPYYFSIVTYTTLGFGDVRPATLWGEVLVSTQVLFGYLTLGLLLSVLAEKVARRS